MSDNNYNFSEIEERWRKIWAEKPGERAKDFNQKPKHYHLIEFPYPSGAGLHVGNCMSYGASDAYVRMKRMQGFNVLFPIGWDAFGLPTENAAIKNKRKPGDITKENINTFRNQMKMLAYSFDFDREVDTTDPNYYKWTQWIFLQFYKHAIVDGKLIEVTDDDKTTPRLAFQAEMPINWCPSCKIGLANEEVVAGKCERCGTEVVKKIQKQWMLRITAYADRLIKDLDTVNYLDKIKTAQINWIGKSTGSEISFKLVDSDKSIKVFTTRADTLFGCTYIVIAPESEYMSELKSKVSNLKEVELYIENTKKKSDLERTDLAKDKTGVKLEGVKAINPINNEEIDVYVADYVLANYGTGAVMAVPAHDDRDFEFAKKYNIPIKQVIANNISDIVSTNKALETYKNISNLAEKDGFKVWILGSLGISFYANNIFRNFSDLDIITDGDESSEHYIKLLKILDRLGFKKIEEKDFPENIKISIFKNADGMTIDLGPNKSGLGLEKEDLPENELILNGYSAHVLSKRYLTVLKAHFLKSRNKETDKIDWEYLHGKTITEYGFLFNSGEFDGLTSEEAKKKITEKLKSIGSGDFTVNYKLRDWIFSRQHYWGEPIPIIHCDKCGMEPINESDLPLTLPEVENYEPTNSGESPLANIDSWVNVKCPKCGGSAKRETDTMPNWAGSSWYYLRYCDPGNDKELASKDKLKYWTPVDLYNGGNEHTTLHLLYSRFWHKFLYDLECVPTLEPYQKRIAHGIILGADGRKMSKSFGNVINPDDIAKKFGVDVVRAYIMFIGPYDQESAWSMAGVQGIYRFLNRIYSGFDKMNFSDEDSKELLVKLNQTIDGVSQDMEAFRMNTVVSKLMELNNVIEKQKSVTKESYKSFIKMLSPVVPFLASEIWNKIGSTNSLQEESWPEIDKMYLVAEKIEIVVQVNGKVRDHIEVDAAISDDELKKTALESEKVREYIKDNEISKTIVVPKKLVSIVLKNI